MHVHIATARQLCPITNLYISFLPLPYSPLVMLSHFVLAAGVPHLTLTCQAQVDISWWQQQGKYGTVTSVTSAYSLFLLVV